MAEIDLDTPVDVVHEYVGSGGSGDALDVIPGGPILLDEPVSETWR